MLSVIASRNFTKSRFWLAAWSVVFVCVSRCLFLPFWSQYSMAVFTKLYTQVGTGLKKNWLGFQGHVVKGHGHSAKIMEMLFTL